jgi:dTDP-4-dehydrorhamnose 3,5-epimerase
MGKFKKIETSLKGVYLLEPTVFEDHRGFFMESYNKKDFEEIGLYYDLIQDNHSLSVEAGVLRGLHFQLNPKAQTKIVRVLDGAIYDVVVDIRKKSPTFGKWVGYELSEENKFMLWIPKGFAHGFLTLSKEAEIIYKVSGSEYSPEHDRGIIWNDKTINIKWPVENIENIILSEKDKNLPTLENADINFVYGG